MDLSTRYLGLALKNPVVASASPLSYKADGIKRLEDAGASAVVMHSLFEEQLTLESQILDHYLGYGAESYAEAVTYFPEKESYNLGPDEYLGLIRTAKEECAIPIIGSLNGVSSGGWTRFAKQMQDAGADALELNIYYIPTDVMMTGLEVEQMYTDVVKEVKDTVTIPVAVKLSPYFSSLAHMAKRLSDAGADGLVLFNRFYQPDFDLENLEVVPDLVLSRSAELLLPLRWTAILYGRVPADIAVTSGVHTYRDVLKSMMAGANVAMMASELLQNGLTRIEQILWDMTRWMEEYEYESVNQMQGSLSQRHVKEPAAFERANYMKVLQSWQQDKNGQVA